MFHRGHYVADSIEHTRTDDVTISCLDAEKGRISVVTCVSGAAGTHLILVQTAEIGD
jgi:hypothetical protein